MNLQDIGRVQFDARISVTAQELYYLCCPHPDIALETARLEPPQGPTYEELVAATLKHCPQAVIVPRTRVAREWALDRVWEVSREEFNEIYPSPHIDHWFAYKHEFVWRARTSVLESLANCLLVYPNCVFYEHGMNVNGQPYKGCRYGFLDSQYFSAFEY